MLVSRIEQPLVCRIIARTTYSLVRTINKTPHQTRRFSLLLYLRTIASKLSRSEIMLIGLLSCFQGPYEGSRGDLAMWKDGMQELIVQNAYDEEGDRVYLYGDAAFYLEDG